jgi:hypothetical protein
MMAPATAATRAERMRDHAAVCDVGKAADSGARRDGGFWCTWSLDGGARPITTRRRATFEIGRVADRFIPHSCGYLGVHPFADRLDHSESNTFRPLPKLHANYLFVLRYQNCSERYLNV